MDGKDQYDDAIIQHLPYIEGLCRQACQGAFNHGFDEVSLFNEIIDRLKEDGYRRFKRFEGQPVPPPYLTQTIRNLLIDIVREKDRRTRFRERAKANGRLGEILYELVLVRHHSAEEAREILSTSYGIRTSLEEVSAIVDGITGRASWLVRPPIELRSLVVGEEGEEIQVPDTRPNARELLLEKERVETINKVLQEIVSRLNGEERLLIRIRFADEEGKTKSMREIAALLGISEKSADKKLRKILKNARETCLKMGLDAGDLVGNLS